MRLFFEIVLQSIRRQLAYKATLLAGLITNFIFGIIRAAILVALYGQQVEVAGIDIQGAITFALVGQAVIGFLSLFGWSDLMQSIYTGEITTELLRPISLFKFWLAHDLGRSILQFGVRGVLIVLLYEIFYDLYYPTSLVQWIILLAAVMLSWQISFAWRFMINLSAFWTPDARGIIRLGFTFSWFASGFLMPLRFFPEWVQTLCYLTPFPHMINSVFEIYLGLLNFQEMMVVICWQIIWIVILWISIQIILASGIKRLVIQGG